MGQESGIEAYRAGGNLKNIKSCRHYSHPPFSKESSLEHFRHTPQTHPRTRTPMIVFPARHTIRPIRTPHAIARTVASSKVPLTSGLVLAAILAGGERSDVDPLAGSLAVGQARKLTRPVLLGSVPEMEVVGGKCGGAVGCEGGRPGLKVDCVRRSVVDEW